MECGFSKHFNQCFLIKKSYNTSDMYTHIIPCRSLMRITIPCCTHIGVWPCEHHQHIGIENKRFVMIGIFHDVSTENLSISFFFHKNRYLRSNWFAFCIRPCQKSKWMIGDKFLEDIQVVFLVIGEGVHGAKVDE